MSAQVSSWFVAQASLQRALPQRRFTLGGSDYSDEVLRWPRIGYRATTVELGTMTLALSNRRRAFQFFVDCDLALTSSAEVALGFTHPTSGEERLSLFVGAPSAVSFGRGGTELRLQLQGKTRRLTDVALGSAVASQGVDFTTSAYHPSDLAWYLITSHGGMSALESDGNPDLDYAQWRAWRDADAIRDVRVKAYLTGEKVYQVIETLAVMDSMLVSFQGGRLRFRDVFLPYSAQHEPLPVEHLLELGLDLDTTDVVNDFLTEADLNPATGKYLASYSRVNSRSVQDFGRHNGRFSSQAVWFAGANDGRYLVEDQVRAHRRPLPGLRAELPLAGGLHRTVGDVVTVTYSFYGLAQRDYRLMAMAVDLERGALTFDLAPALRRPWQYQGNVSSSNLRPRTLAAVDSALLAIDEADNLVHRTDSAGYFRPMNTYAQALLFLETNQVLFGGPSSGSSQSQMRRSSDGGSSSVIIQTLAAGINLFDIFETRAGNFLASISSGGILRTIDAGSSWNLTWTISPAYQVDRFFEPWSGTLWGATGFGAGPPANGLHIWVSTDDGVSWNPRHTVIASGQYRSAGLHRLTDSEALFSVYGTSLNELNIFRSKYTAPDSIAWTAVASAAGFSHILRTASGDLLAGFHQELTLNGGYMLRSTDQGSSWAEDARLAKQGNLRLLDNGDGTIEAFLSRTSAGARTDRYRNFEPDRLD